MIKAVTHDSIFHGDDIVAIAILKLVHGDVDVVRSRDPEILKRALADPGVFVVDVGGVHDPKMGNFDHHQIACRDQYDSGIRKASAGLLWDHFGRELLSRSCPAECVEEAFVEVSRRFIEPLDGLDNGQLDQRFFNRENGFQITAMSCTTFLTSFNNYRCPTPENQLPNFHKAVEVALRGLESCIEGASLRQTAKRVVRATYDAAQSPIIVVEEDVPVQEAAAMIPQLRYVITPNRSNEAYTALAVADRMKSRAPFPQAWRGLSGEQLVEASGIPDLIFCHKAGFMLSARTKDAALDACKASLATTLAGNTNRTPEPALAAVA